jgi:diguanylate cyclase (GGDEF)-like protein/PAS domain S-box-containing protein
MNPENTPKAGEHTHGQDTFSSPQLETGPTQTREVSQEIIKLMLEQVNLVVYLRQVDEVNSTLYINPYIDALLGFSPQEWIEEPETWFIQILPEDRERVLAEHLSSIETGKKIDLEYRMTRFDGNVIWVHETAFIVGKPGSKDRYWLGTLEDITERKISEEFIRENESKFRNFIQQSSEGILLTNELGEIIDINPSMEFVTGINKENTIGLKIWDLLVGLMTPEQKLNEFSLKLKNDLQEMLLTGQSINLNQKIEGYFKLPDGSFRVVLQTIFPIRTARGYGLGLSTHDITDRKQVENKLLYMSTHDTLTSLFNRAFFEAESSRLENSRLYPISVLAMDLDYLKLINDRLGHSAGDELIRRTAHVLLASFRSEDVVARIGGDEFAVLLPNTNAATANRAFERVLENLIIDNNAHPDFPLSISIGVATGDENSTVHEIIRHADNLMYQEKARHKSKGLPPAPYS